MKEKPEVYSANRYIKTYFYLTSGMSVVNEFRNLFFGVFAVYFSLKLNNPLWIILMFAISIPALIVVGYINIHKVSKVREWLNIKFGTHYGIQQFDYVKRQTELLEEIKKKL